MTDPLDDGFATTLTAAQSGAGWAAELLWRSLAPAVVGYLRMQGAAEPEDLTSDVFIGVFRGLGSFSGTEREFRSWVFTIAHRRVTDQRRRAGRRPPIASLGESPRDEPRAPSAERDALERIGTEEVLELCGRLVPDQRDVVLLRLVAGLTVDEVASALGKSEGAIKALQRRALVALRKILEREGVPL